MNGIKDHTRVYARAAAWILGADRFDERVWRQLEKQAGVETAEAVAKPETDKQNEPQAGRITTPNDMRDRLAAKLANPELYAPGMGTQTQTW